MTRSLERRPSIAPQTEENTMTLERRLSTAPLCRNLFGAVDHEQTGENLMTLEKRTATAPLCRNLFGAVDHEQLSRDLNRQLEEMAERDQRRWNFSFDTEEPLDGEYRWETVPWDRTASFYRGSEAGEDEVTEEIHVRPNRLDDEESKASLAETNRENISSVSNTLRFPSEGTPVRRKRTKASPDNARITDFFVKRRRSSDSRPLKSPLSFPSEALWKGLR
ncbi:cyclin dependent kinase inhibitor 1Ca [Gadus chalcogrammus]|uniref:cyclin dependent kinase inhibitor 1Ca n=1 Tax=Gadus chalcogrammus TaxID=1042646 RepID=UPI0024C4C296|nr:cyclin dependent kinase inhibitor 1Ca [Gadus chalcogrammus]